MERICKAINDCDVLVSEMRMIRDRGMEQMNTLLKIYKTQSSTTSFAFDTSRLKDNSGLVLRLKELEHLETTQKQLFNLYTHMEEFWPCDSKFQSLFCIIVDDMANTASYMNTSLLTLILYCTKFP